jgi:hypothetical protein
MRHELIHFNGHIYMVDKEAKTKHKGDWVVETDDPLVTSVVECLRTFESDTDLKILACTDPSLGLPLFPEIEEEDNWLHKHAGYADDILAKKAEDFYNERHPSQHWTFGSNYGNEVALFIRSILPVDSAKKWTDDDLLKYMELRMEIWKGIMKSGEFKGQDKPFEKTDEAVHQRALIAMKPLPIAVEVEMEYENYLVTPTHKVVREDKPMIPKVVNNIIQVKQWIYES